MPVLLGFLAMFGIGGLFGSVAFGLGPAGRTAVALAFGTFGAGVAFAIFAALRRAEGHEPTALRDLIGRKARVTVSIGERGHGTISLTYDGAVQTLAAIATAPIARGREVEILGVHGMAVTVRSLPPP
jgi:membrane protein implicated in regulation of membrane protease activity